MLRVEVSNRTPTELNVERLVEAAATIAQDHGYRRGEISIAIVDDAAIHELNRRYLNHDYATDVLSFVLDKDEDRLEGEIVVSLDTAASAADQFAWSTEEELLLYVVHGALHLVGLDDHQPDARANMRRREAHYLERSGCRAVFDADGRRLTEDAEK